MATFLRVCWSQKDSVTTELFRRAREAEKHRLKEYAAAVRLQSWWRGIVTRNRIRFLHQQATLIQRNFRGFSARQQHLQRVREAVKEMYQRHYFISAVKIQKTWRGYFVRRHVANYYTRKQYIEGVQSQNTLLRARVEAQVKERKQREAEKQRQRREEEFMELARRHHYMASTAVVDGVYHGYYQTGRDLLLEETMHGLKSELKPSRKWHDHLREHYFKTNARPMPTTASLSFSTSDRQPSVTLPPIKPKMQGPFRSPEEVAAQRHRPLDPTLRVSTSITSAEDAKIDAGRKEWLKRIQDKPIQPFTKVEHHYVKLIHTQSDYKRPPHGTQRFREELPSTQHYSDKGFNLQTRPVNLFDQVNKEYTV